MGKTFESIGESLAGFLGAQRIFFVASAPLSADGHVNTSPKGGDAFRILGPREVAYQDYTGSGAETVAHLRENGRIVLMWCAFEGPPRIVRLHGTGRVVLPADPDFESLAARFPWNAGTRASIRVAVNRVSDSCGYAVPRYSFSSPRAGLDSWAKGQGAQGLATYRQKRNVNSIDGLPAFDAGEA